MKSKLVLCVQVLFAVAVISGSAVFGQELKTIKLPAPQMNGGKPLMQALKERKTGREFSNKKIPVQTLSNLLWAADGINRPDGKRTAPSAMNMQEIDIYAAMSDGLYLYDAKQNSLKMIFSEDIRALTGSQPFVKEVPLNLIYVADISKFGNTPEKDVYLYVGADTGFISQNVYLFCASEGLATVVRGYVDKPALEKKMNLNKNQKVILAQSVGYPEK
ncbi:MAG: SagB/ThcOx family dehydrogenase [Elusimicrobiota bacterium]